jgi:hypothetical protein
MVILDGAAPPGNVTAKWGHGHVKNVKFILELLQIQQSAAD